MYSSFHLAIKFLRYYFNASNGKGHGIHSPFVFQLVTKVLNDKTEYPSYKEIERQRSLLLGNETIIEVDDFGAGSVKGLKKKRVVQVIAASSLKPKKYAQLLFRLVQYFQPKEVLELGTSLGITTSYLASAQPSADVKTLEGSPVIASIAQQTWDALQIKNIKPVVGHFDEILSSVTDKRYDFIFIDGNHRQEPTIRYFNQLLGSVHNDSVLVFDDIHWSEEMEEAWEQIKAHPSVKLSIDLFFIGLVFFRKQQLEKEHFTIRF